VRVNEWVFVRRVPYRKVIEKSLVNEASVKMTIVDQAHLINFNSMNEADIRAEVIDPLLRRLGYGLGTEFPIMREREIKLRYPHIYLGRKSPGKDILLRGRPDYICEVRGFARWVVEAKPPTQEIGIDDIEQAHSYATHPEIQARFFVLCNGRTLSIYESNRGPNTSAIVTLDYRELEKNHYALVNLLSPDAIKRNYSQLAIDIKRPLGQGFGSKVRIVNGQTQIDSIDT
jgi:hypothetical protein